MCMGDEKEEEREVVEETSTYKRISTFRPRGYAVVCCNYYLVNSVYVSTFRNQQHCGPKSQLDFKTLYSSEYCVGTMTTRHPTLWDSHIYDSHIYASGFQGITPYRDQC